MRQNMVILVILSWLLTTYVPITGAREVHQAYVVCGDGKIYVIDVEKGQLLTVSSVIPELAIGKPTCIDIDRSKKILYVGCERRLGKRYMASKYRRYYPIIAVDLKRMEVIKKFTLDAGNICPVYEIKLSPDGRRIYAGYAHPKYRWSNPAYGGGSVVIDVSTGDIIGALSFRVHPYSIFSKDGRRVTEIRADRVTVYDVEKDERVLTWEASELFKKGLGLNPLGRKLKGPLCIIENHKVLKKIDRLTGKVLSQLTLDGETMMKYPVITANGEKALISVIKGDFQGYIVIVDLMDDKIYARIKVGRFPTNVVINEQ